MGKSSALRLLSGLVTFALAVTCEKDREREHLGDDSGDEQPCPSIHYVCDSIGADDVPIPLG